MAQAVTQLFEGAKFSIGPAIENGFYYDFELPGGKTFSDDDLAAIEAKMAEIVKADQPFIRDEVSPADALKLFADQPYKCEIIERVSAGGADTEDAGEIGGGETISIYRNTDGFVDLCRGPHVPSTGKLGHYKLMKVAGAYWRGNEKGRCCSGSTVRRGRARRHSPNTFIVSRRPRSATTASWRPSSIC
jgi:threonyl-tRNA synthetase